MSIISFLGIVRRRWLLVSSCLVLGVVAAAAFSATTTKTYVAEARSFVTITAAESNPNAVYQNGQFAMQRVMSYTLLVDSPEVLEPVRQDLGLSSVSLRQLRAKVSAENPPDTTILNVQVSDSSPSRAAQIADDVANQLNATIESLEQPRSGSASPIKVTVTAPATIPLHPTSPRWPLNIALGLLAGLAIGLAGAVLRTFLDTAVRSEKDIQDLAEISPIGLIPVDPAASGGPLVAVGGRSRSLESFRTLRSNLRFAHIDNPVRSLVVTSALPNEGKSTTSQNLAIAVAQSGVAVCLVDADLRKPSITDNLGINGAIGLTDVLVEEYTLDQVLVPWNRGLLHVLPAGTTPADPASLLGSHRAEEVLKDLCSRFDLVILDSPPLLAASDAAVLGGMTDGALVVARVGKTRRDQLRRALDALQAVSADLIGVVLTFVPDKGDMRYEGSYGAYTPSNPASADVVLSPEQERAAVGNHRS